MNISFSRTSSLLTKYAAGNRSPWYRGQLEGLYSTKPKFHGGELPGGHKYQTLPQAAVGYAKRPLQSLRKSWAAIGPKRELVGVKPRKGKLPKLVFSRSGEVSRRKLKSSPKILKSVAGKLPARVSKTGKRILRSPKGKIPSRLAPSLQRAMLVGSALEAGRAAIKGKKENRGMHIGRGVGGTLGWLASARMKMLPSMVTWGAGEAIGGALGKALTRKKAPK